MHDMDLDVDVDVDEGEDEDYGKKARRRLISKKLSEQRRKQALNEE